MTKRYGKARVPGCECWSHSTCAACLQAAPGPIFTPNAPSDRALRRELEQMTPREVEKFRDWCDRNAVPVVLV